MQEVHAERESILAQTSRTVTDNHRLQPLEIYVDDEKKLTLHGLQQHYVRLEESAKNRKLNDLLDSLEFNQVRPTDCCAPSSPAHLPPRPQVVIFVKSVARATQLDQLLRECNFPSIAIHSGLPQEERIKRYQQFKAFEKRVLVATDIFARGLDVSRNALLVLALADSTPIGRACQRFHLLRHPRRRRLLPSPSRVSPCVPFLWTARTHHKLVHRRAGRFGTKGLAITFVSSEPDEEVFKLIQARFEIAVTELPETIDPATYSTYF